jgi:hypothetical protein
MKLPAPKSDRGHRSRPCHSLCQSIHGPWHPDAERVAQSRERERCGRRPPGRPAGTSPYHHHGAALRRFAAQHGDKPPAERAQLWPAAISKETMGRALKRMGGTRKQSPIATPKATRKNAQPTTRNERNLRTTNGLIAMKRASTSTGGPTHLSGEILSNLVYG